MQRNNQAEKQTENQTNKQTEKHTDMQTNKHTDVHAMHIDMQKTLAVIDLRAIRQNALKAKGKAEGKKFFAVVKDDAYGHGMEEVARQIEDIVDGFCVAITDEGVALRVAQITKPILVLTPPLCDYDFARAKNYNLLISVNSVETAKKCSIPCHIQINTGMNRMGCSIDELPEILRYTRENTMGVYSHLYAPQSAIACAEQYALFERAARFVKTYYPAAMAHLAASGGLLRGGRYLFDGVRAGILLYGYNPSGFSFDVTPALKVYAKRVQTTRFAGGGIGYNFADKKYDLLGVYRLGYGDGFSRIVPLGEKTLCMDSFISQSTDEYICVLDDANAYAQKLNTIAYEVLTRATGRSERVYIR